LAQLLLLITAGVLFANSKEYIWNVALYAAEAEMLTKASQRLLEAFELWILRGVLTIS